MCSYVIAHILVSLEVPQFSRMEVLIKARRVAQKHTNVFIQLRCDIFLKLILHNHLSQVENSQAFVWLSQLRHRWGEREKHCFANICDAQFLYSYEYLGNTPRLVITPLTDR